MPMVGGEEKKVNSQVALFLPFRIFALLLDRRMILVFTQMHCGVAVIGSYRNSIRTSKVTTARVDAMQHNHTWTYLDSSKSYFTQRHKFVNTSMKECSPILA